MDPSQLRVQALQMSLQVRQQSASQAPTKDPETDDATTTRAEKYFAFLSGGGSIADAPAAIDPNALPAGRTTSARDS